MCLKWCSFDDFVIACQIVITSRIVDAGKDTLVPMQNHLWLYTFKLFCLQCYDFKSLFIWTLQKLTCVWADGQTRVAFD